MKPTIKIPSKDKIRQNKRKKRGEERKSKKDKNMLSADARTSQADILHLDQKATKCMTCKRLCGKF